MQLYKIADEYRQALEVLQDEFDPQTVEDSLAAIKGELETKGEAVASFALNIDSDIKQLKQHEDEIKAKRQTLEKRRDWLRDYLRQNMERCGISKIECPLFKISIGKPSKVVVIDDEKSLPRDYIKVVESPDKTLIKQALNDGYKVPGAKLSDGKAALRIK